MTVSVKRYYLMSGLLLTKVIKKWNKKQKPEEESQKAVK